MVSSEILFRKTTSELEKLYGKQEAQSLSFLLLETLFSITRSDILAGKEIEAKENTALLDDYIDRLNHSEPIQYILGQTEFYGHRFEVNKHVLIPRPETEELVHLIISENKKTRSLSVLDIGTGSGCIAIALKKELPFASVLAMDVSKEALDVAKKNAESNKAAISFLHNDILSDDTEIPSTNIIVSNPPYVTHSEKKRMQQNVLAHEPHLALFVEDQDPLLFYRIIAKKAFRSLLPQGKVYFEINEQFGNETITLLTQAGFESVEIKKDLFGKDRIAKGEKPI